MVRLGPRSPSLSAAVPRPPTAATGGSGGSATTPRRGPSGTNSRSHSDRPRFQAPGASQRRSDRAYFSQSGPTGAAQVKAREPPPNPGRSNARTSRISVACAPRAARRCGLGRSGARRVVDDRFAGGSRNRFELGVRAQLGQHRLHVVAHSVDAQVQLGRDHLVGPPSGQQREDLTLSLGQVRTQRAARAVELREEARQERRGDDLKGPRTPRPDLMSQNVLGKAHTSWLSPFSIGSSGACSRSFVSTGRMQRPRTPRSSFCGTNWPCFAGRSHVPASPGPTVPSSPSWPVLFLENTGDRSWSAHRRSWAGTARWSRSAGPTRTADQVVLVLPKRPWS